MTSGSLAVASSSSVSSPALTWLYSSVSSVHSSTRPVDPSLQWNPCSFSSLGVVSHSCSEAPWPASAQPPSANQLFHNLQLNESKREHLESPSDWVSSITQLYFTFISTDLFFLVWWFCNSSKILPLRHFPFVCISSFILNAHLSLGFVFCVFLWGFVFLWALFAICYVWDYISSAVASLCWLIPADCVGATFVRSSVVNGTGNIFDVLSEVWCPEDCSNNVLIKAGKSTHLSTSLPVSVFEVPCAIFCLQFHPRICCAHLEFLWLSYVPIF